MIVAMMNSTGSAIRPMTRTTEQDERQGKVEQQQLRPAQTARPLTTRSRAQRFRAEHVAAASLPCGSAPRRFRSRRPNR